MTIKELLKRYKGLYYNQPSFDAKVLTIVNNSEVRAVLDSHGLNSRAFVCLTPGNLLVGRKCLEIRVPYDLWHGRTSHVDSISSHTHVDRPEPTPDVEAELAKLRAWVRALAVAGTHAFDPGQRHHSGQVLNEIDGVEL